MDLTKLKNAAAALAVELEKEPDKQDAAKRREAMVAVREAILELKGSDGPGEFEAFRKSIEDRLKVLADEQVRLSRMGLEKRGNLLVVSGRKARLDLLEDGRVFLDPDHARRCGAWAARSIFSKYAGRYESMIPKETRDLGDEVAKALDPTVGASGEYLMRDEFVAQLIAMLEAVGVVYPLCGRVALATTGITYYPALTGELLATPIAAGAKIGETAPTFDIVGMQPIKWGTMTPIPNEFFRNAALLADLGQLVARLMVRAIAYAADNAVLNGDGTADYGGITGLLQSATIAEVVPAAAADHDEMAEIVGADISAVPAGITKDYVIDPYWLMHLTVARTLRGLKDSNGQPLYLRGENGEPNSIDGYPYRISQRMPLASAVAADDCYALFGRIDMAMFFGMLGGIDVATSSEVYFDKDMTVVRGLAYFDAKEVDSDAVVRAMTHS